MNEDKVRIAAPKFKLGDVVYYNTPDSPRGIVTDCVYSARTNDWHFMVSFGLEIERACYIEELLEDKIY